MFAFFGHHQIKEFLLQLFFTNSVIAGILLFGIGVNRQWDFFHGQCAISMFHLQLVDQVIVLSVCYCADTNAAK